MYAGAVVNVYLPVCNIHITLAIGIGIKLTAFNKYDSKIVFGFYIGYGLLQRIGYIGFAVGFYAEIFRRKVNGIRVVLPGLVDGFTGIVFIIGCRFSKTNGTCK